MVDFKRFERQIKMKEIGPEVQRRWAESKVLIIGAGGLGCGVIQALSSAGVGSITILDGDAVAQHNLHRQWLFNESSIGFNKALKAADWVKEHNPDIQVNGIPTHLREENASQYVKDFNVWIDATDNVSAKLLIDTLAVQYQTPWVFGSAEQWDGQVSVFQYPDSNGKIWRYVDFFTAQLEDPMVGSCQQRGVLGPVVHTIAMFQSLEVLRILGNLSPLHVGKMFCWDAWQSRSYPVSL
jgi:adenylyltransferase/sulfurtransferase